MKYYKLTRPVLHVRYDEASAFVVLANTPREARQLASERAGDEGAKTWLDPKLSKCARLPNRPRPMVILRDFNAG